MVCRGDLRNYLRKDDCGNYTEISLLFVVDMDGRLTNTADEMNSESLCGFPYGK